MSIPQKLVLSVLTLLIMLSPLSLAYSENEPEAKQEIQKGTVTGKIMAGDTIPLSFGQVMFYDVAAGPPPLPNKYERIPDISKTIDAKGNFTVELPEGRYYVGAIKRLSGERFGPPQEGDYIVRILDEKGKPKEYHVKAGTLLELDP